MHQHYRCQVAPQTCALITTLSGELSMVVEHRALNKVTVEKCCALLRLNDLSDRLLGAKSVSCLDAASGFNQILLRNEDKPKTGLRTPVGSVPLQDFPLGLTDAPGTFQSVINNLFSPLMFCAEPEAAVPW